MKSAIKNHIVPRILVGIPTEGHTDTAPLHSIMAMQFHHGKLAAEGKFDFYMATCGRIFTPMAREKFLYEAIQNKMDYLLMVDDDMVCPFDLFDRLYRHQVDICAALA